MISIAAPTKPKVDREAFPIPGPYKNKKKIYFTQFNKIHVHVYKVNFYQDQKN